MKLSTSCIIGMTVSLLIVGGIVLFRALGYSTANGMYDAEELAKQFAEEGRGAEACLKIKTFFPTYPPLAVLQAGCIHEYASLTKDPAACELLMPSSYGISCLGGAMNFLPCKIYSKEEIRWSDGNSGFQTTLQECVNSVDSPLDKRGQCCLISINTYVRSMNDCFPLLSDKEMFDQCQYEVSVKNHDASTCSPIFNENIRSACTVEATALEKDPSICTKCRPAVENIEDLLATQ